MQEPQQLQDNQPASQPEVAAVSPASTEKPTISPFQRLSEQEKGVRSERERLRALNSELEQAKKDAKAYQELKNKNPFEILAHFGVTDEKIIEADQLRQDPVAKLKKEALEEVNKLRNEIMTEKEKAQQERLARAEIELRSQIDTTIKEKEFDLIEKLDAQDSVKDYMEEMYAQTGEIPEVSDACQAVLDHIIAKYRSVENSKWLTKKQAAEITKAADTIKNVDTLSNKMVQTTETVAPNRLLSDEELSAAARKAYLDALKRS